MSAPFVVIPRSLLAQVLTCLTDGDTTETAQANARDLAVLLEERIDVADRRVAA